MLFLNRTNKTVHNCNVLIFLLGVRKVTTFQKVFLIFIVIQPLIDIMTSVMTILQMPLTVGAIFRAVLIGILFIFITNYLVSKRKFDLLFIWICPFLMMLITFTVNFYFKKPFYMISEINFILKTSYYIVFTFFALIVIDKHINLHPSIERGIPIVSIIIGVSFWLSIVTGTNIASYGYGKTGYSGWFFSANELSVTVLILLILTVIHLNDVNKERRAIQFLSLIFLLSLLPMIGTKTALGGGVIIISTYTMYLLFFSKERKKSFSFRFTYLTIVTLFIIFIPFTPVISNTTNIDLNDQFIEQKQQLYNERKIIHPLVNQLLSSRDIYLLRTSNDFYNAPLLQQLFGISYGGKYINEPKLIEMDFFDLLFSYGYIGFFILIIPLMFLVQKTFSLKRTITNVIFQLGIFLILSISFLAGHMLFAPSVMTYFTILFLQGVQFNERKLGELS